MDSLDTLYKALEALAVRIDGFHRLTYREARISEEIKSILTRIYAIRAVPDKCDVKGDCNVGKAPQWL